MNALGEAKGKNGVLVGFGGREQSSEKAQGFLTESSASTQIDVEGFRME